MGGLDSAIHAAAPLAHVLGMRLLPVSMDPPVIGERSDAVLRTAMPVEDDESAVLILRTSP
jgi:hypothetical protein